MDTQGWERVKELFHEALKLAPEERERMLSQEAAEVRAELEALLDAHEEAGPGPTESATAEEGPGSIIDRYKLLQEIGAGGFGVVYLAEQAEPIRRKVALKIIKLGMDTKQVVARFEAERQALALMDHPNIAKVLDGGATPHGRPYFVMELVKGIPLTEYCDQAGLDTTERLELFAEVCRAVQHAHQKGIIHRDLKPGNVLVTLHDGRPVPKVIDFGIAKATDRSLTEKTLFTEFRQIIGTPEYMAPEQAELTSLDVDTRADVYSLGVLLYELLTDTKPFDVTELLQQGYGEMLRTLREVDPPRPSTRLSTLGDQLPIVAKKRHTPPQALGKLMRGDLDWIVMKALEKDRSRRYDTAAALADDIHRHLKDVPVEAGPPSRAYRLRKYVKRNRAAVGAAAAILLALVGGLVAAFLGLGEARHQADLARRAEQDAVHQAALALDAEEEARSQAALARNAEADATRQRDDATAARAREAEERTRAEAGEAEAKKEALRAKTALDLVEQALSAANPHNSKSPGYTVRQLLEDIERDLDAKVEGQPEIEAAIRHTIGAAYSGLGLHRQAKPHIERALAIRRELLSGDHERTLDTHYEWTHVLRDQGRLQEAVEETRKVWKACSRVLGDEHRDTVRAGLAYAKGLVDLARYDEADAVILPVRRAAHEALGLRDTSTLETDTVLSYLRIRQGRIEEAATVASASFERTRALCGADSHYLTYPLGQLVHVEHARGNYAQAETHARRLWELNRETFGSDHPWTRTAQYRVADMLRLQGRLDAARTLYEEALAFFRAHQPDDPNTTGVVLHNFAEVERLAGNYGAAERHLREALAIGSTALGEDHPNCGLTLSGIAGVLNHQARYEEAEENERRAADILERAYGSDHPHYASAVEGLGMLARTRGRFAEAERYLREAARIYETAYGEHHTVTARGWANLAATLLDSGQYVEAEEVYRDSLRVLRETVPGHAHVGAALNSLGEVYRRTGRLDEATEYLEAALEFQQEKLGPRHPALAVTLGNLALVHIATGALPAARVCSERALEIQRAVHGPQHPNVALALANLGRLESVSGALETAERHFREAIDICTGAGQPPHPHTGRVLVELGQVLVKQGRSAEALVVLERAVPLLHEAFGPESEWTLNAEIQRALRVGELRDPGKAHAQLQRLRTRVATSLGEEHPLNVAACQGLAIAAGAAGRPAEAVEHAREALRRLAPTTAGSPSELMLRGTLAQALHSARRWPEAAAQWEKVITLARRLHGARSREVCGWLSWRSEALERLGRYDEAVKARSEARDILREVGSIAGGDLALGELTLDAMRGRRLLHRGEREEAERAFRRILEDHAETLAREDAVTAEMLSSLGFSFQQLQLHAEAEDLYRRSHRRYAKLQGANAATTHAAATRLALDLVAQEKYAEAVAWLEGLVEAEGLPPASRARLQAPFGMALLAAGEPAAAERVLRACLAFREQAMPEHWLRWNTVSLLGQSLGDQGKYEEAEPLLLESYEKMDPPAVSAHRKEEARARLVRLYEGWGKPEMADRWRAPSEEAEPDLDEPPDGTDDSTSPDVRTR